MDPRVKTPVKDLQVQHDLSLICYEGKKQCTKLVEELRLYEAKMEDSKSKMGDNGFNNLMNDFKPFKEKMDDGKDNSFNGLKQLFTSAFNNLQDNDMPPTITLINAVKQANQSLRIQVKNWELLKIKIGKQLL